MKIAIVGAEESKWTKEQKKKVQAEIRLVFYQWLDTADMYGGETILISGGCHRGGVDIWAEEVADNLGINKMVFPAEIYQWGDGSECLCCGEIIPFTSEEKITEHTKARGGTWNNTKRLKGYRSRNIQIAEACDILYNFEPEGVRSGGRWTLGHANMLGKPVHQIFIPKET